MGVFKKIKEAKKISHNKVVVVVMGSFEEKLDALKCKNRLKGKRSVRGILGQCWKLEK